MSRSSRSTAAPRPGRRRRRRRPTPRRRRRRRTRATARTSSTSLLAQPRRRAAACRSSPRPSPPPRRRSAPPMADQAATSTSSADWSLGGARSAVAVACPAAMAACRRTRWWSTCPTTTMAPPAGDGGGDGRAAAGGRNHRSSEELFDDWSSNRAADAGGCVALGGASLVRRVVGAILRARAFLLYHYLPYDKSLWGRLRSPPSLALQLIAWMANTPSAMATFLSYSCCACFTNEENQVEAEQEVDCRSSPAVYFALSGYFLFWRVLLPASVCDSLKPASATRQWRLHVDRLLQAMVYLGSRPGPRAVRHLVELVGAHAKASVREDRRPSRPPPQRLLPRTTDAAADPPPRTAPTCRRKSAPSSPRTPSRLFAALGSPCSARRSPSLTAGSRRRGPTRAAEKSVADDLASAFDGAGRLGAAEPGAKAGGRGYPRRPCDMDAANALNSVCSWRRCARRPARPPSPRSDRRREGTAGHRASLGARAVAPVVRVEAEGIHPGDPRFLLVVGTIFCTELRSTHSAMFRGISPAGTSVGVLGCFSRHPHRRRGSGSRTTRKGRPPCTRPPGRRRCRVLPRRPGGRRSRSIAGAARRSTRRSAGGPHAATRFALDRQAPSSSRSASWTRR